MTSSRTILKNLKGLTEHLNHFAKRQRPTYFEKLVAESLSHILHLPFYASDNDNDTIAHRVIWQGKVNPVSKAPGGGPDAIARCYHFDLIIEATTKPGPDQWSKELAQSIRHCKDFCSRTGAQPSNVYILLLCSNLHADTYESIKANPKQKYRLIPIRVTDLAIVLETSILAFTMRHLELRKLLHLISNCITNTSSPNEFSGSVSACITGWQKDVLRLEKSTFIGVRSYEVMRRIGGNVVSASEIIQQLQKHPFVGQYLNIVGEKITIDEIENDLMQQSLAYIAGRTIQDDVPLFEPVHSADFRARGLRVIKAVERING